MKWPFLFPVLLLFVWTTPVQAAGYEDLSAEEQRRAVSLYSHLKCPVCKSQSLASSTSFLAEQMKAQIRGFVVEGKTNEEIIEHYVARYGDWILMSPRTSGSSLLAWVVPVVVVVMAGFWLMLALRRWSRRTRLAENNEQSQDSRISDAYRDRIDALLQEP